MNDIANIGIESLRIARDTLRELEDEGLKEANKNRFGDVSLLADIEIEKRIIKYFQKEKMPFRINSEEHGFTNISEKPEYLVVMDGLDGSGIYKKTKGKGRFGTMLAIFSGIEPTYNDYLFNGIIDHSSGNIYYGVKGHGSYVLESGKKLKIKCSKNKELNKNTRIYVDEYFEINKKVFSLNLKDYRVECLGASSIYYVDLVSGKADLVLECTRKNNLELVISYGLVKEAGGCMISINGEDLGNKEYFKYGHKEHIPVITGSTKELCELVRMKVGDYSK